MCKINELSPPITHSYSHVLFETLLFPLFLEKQKQIEKLKKTKHRNMIVYIDSDPHQNFEYKPNGNPSLVSKV